MDSLNAEPEESVPVELSNTTYFLCLYGFPQNQLRRNGRHAVDSLSVK